MIRDLLAVVGGITLLVKAVEWFEAYNDLKEENEQLKARFRNQETG